MCIASFQNKHRRVGIMSVVAQRQKKRKASSLGDESPLAHAVKYFVTGMFTTAV